MNTESTQTSLSTAPVHDPVCKRCGSHTFERLQRISFLQRSILPFFNLYPWRCVICNKRTYRTARNNAELRRQSRQ